MVFNTFFKDKKKENLQLLRRIADEHKDDLIRKKVEETVEKKIESLHIKEKFDILFKRLNELEQKIKEFGADRVYEESLRKRNTKNKILVELSERGKLTALQLCKLINLSRNRCSEYLNELEREGIVKGIKIGRRKYYERLD